VADGRSTAQSRLRSAKKLAAAADFRVRALLSEADSLARAEENIGELVPHSETDYRLSGPRLIGYSRSQVERALKLYLSDGDTLAAHPPLAVEDIDGAYRDDEEDAPDLANDPLWGRRVQARPRSRNVFGDRMSWPERGRKDGHALPRGPGSEPSRFVRRADLQSVFRRVSARSAEVAYMRGIADWEFDTIAVHYGYSKQAARKAYAKALADLQTALNGRRAASDDPTEMADAQANREHLMARRLYLLRQAARYRAVSVRLQERLPALEAEAQLDVLEPVAA
jgi:hypothetical protein